MRRVLSLILSITIAILSVSQGFSAFAQESEINKLYNFAEELSDMVRENPVDISFVEDNIEKEIFKADVFYGSLIEKDLPDDAFETKRLIVKSKKSIDYCGAVDCVSGYKDLHILQYDSVAAAKIAYSYYLTCDYIDYVEPDVIMSAQAEIDMPEIEVDDSDISDMNDVTAEAIEWLSDKIGFNDIKDELSEMINDDYILVAVLDSGIDTDHEYFVDRLVPSDYNGSSSGERGSVEDDYGHGTHVAGIIVGNTLENVKIKPYKVLNEIGNGSLSSIATAVDLAVADGADIINMSLTAQNKSQTMTDAVNNAVANDVNVVTAAGNKHSDLDNVYVTPACIDSAITVSATDRNDNLASFSNYDGPIDIAAPGERIKSCYLNNTYTSMSGTSMAAPQVSAGLAILQTMFADKPAIECEEMIKEYAIVMHENEGENHFGAGLLYLKYLIDGKPTTADPVFSVDSCTFTEPFDVSITCPESDADIYYVIYNTGDLGAINWFDSFEYASPIRIATDTKIAAFALVDGKQPSSIVTVEYDRFTESEEQDFDINSAGFITDYYGSKTDLIIPEIIKGVIVNGIASKAFENKKFLKSVVLPDTAAVINSNAFSGCSNLESVTGAGITTVGMKSFSTCENLTIVDFPRLEGVADYAFTESGIINVNMPNVTSLGTNAFNGCAKLETASLPSVESINIGTFRNCTALKSVDISSATQILANAFRNTGIERIKFENVEKIGNFAFCDNELLVSIILSDVVGAGAYAFQNCPSLRAVALPKLKEINANFFKDCPLLKTIYFPSVESVAKKAFDGSSVEYLKFDSVKSIDSLPDSIENLIISSTVKKISTVPSTNFSIYGYRGTYAEEFATENNKEFFSVPSLVSEQSDMVDIELGYIFAYAVGFNCTYQWYKNDVNSNENGVFIEGANSFYYKPSRSDNAEVYYCVITSDDGINSESVTTKAILNAPEYKDADYTEFNALLKEYHQIDKSLYKDGEFDEVDKLLKIDVTEYSLAEQEQLDEYVKHIRELIDSAELKVILYDVNADNKISIIDARLTLKAVVGSYILEKNQLAAADVNGDGKVSIADSRAILKKVLDQ